jgi:hypothetical protein
MTLVTLIIREKERERKRETEMLSRYSLILPRFSTLQTRTWKYSRLWLMCLRGAAVSVSDGSARVLSF